MCERGVSLASAAATAPKPATAAPYNCVTLVPAARLAALTGGTFTLARSTSVAAQGASFCGYNGWAQPPADGALVGNAQATDSSLSIFSGKTAAGKVLVAKEWKVYAHPPADGRSCRAPVVGSTAPAPDPRDCTATSLTGLGDQAVECNDYIVVQKGLHAVPAVGRQQRRAPHVVRPARDRRAVSAHEDQVTPAETPPPLLRAG